LYGLAPTEPLTNTPRGYLSQLRFSRLLEAQMTMMDKEKALTKRARGLTNEVLKERIALQEAKFQESEETVSAAPHSIPHTHVATY
jgi:hypothetical protein